MPRPGTSIIAGLLLVGCSASHSSAPAVADAGASMTFAQASDAALATLENVFYTNGNWQFCVPTPCSYVKFDDVDWGADSLTAALWLRWSVAMDASIPPMMGLLDAKGATYGTCTAQSCPSWSDTPLWDSIAASHEHLVLGTDSTLKRAEGAFDYVDTATQFALGACPEIDFQAPVGVDSTVLGGVPTLKTLETDSNYIKAALLLYQITGKPTYLDKAKSKYAGVRRYYLDPQAPLYTVYVLDDGHTCTPITGRFYGSVNGNMIWNGVTLAVATGTSSFLDDAIATAEAVSQKLADPSGIYADLQTDDDVVEPLIEAMYALAATPGQTFAKDWLRTNATAMAAARAPSGAYGRFFDGPAPTGPVTAWQSNGGLALAFAAGALAPDGVATTDAAAWDSAVEVADDLSTLPSSVQFNGRAIAIFGTLGETDHQLGQASVVVDGLPTYDQTGIHQNQTNALGPVPHAVLFAWRWPASGSHTLTFQAGPTDPKNGGPFLHVESYSYVP